MNKNSTKFSLPMVGTSSLLVIFAVLCLTVFALLSLSSVQADQRLGDAAAKAVENYYAADTRAETILAQLRQGQQVSGVEEHNGVYSYCCPISETQTLEVSIRLENDSYIVLRWQAVSTFDWQSDDTLHVWDGQDP